VNSQTNWESRYRRLAALAAALLLVTSGPLPSQAAEKEQPATKSASAFFPAEIVTYARANARRHEWARAIQDPLVTAAAPWLAMSDDDLWNLMFGNTLKRAWQVWSDGYCPACKKPVPMYEWVPEALKQPWKMRCPQCKELFPKNDFGKFFRSGLDEHNVFDPPRADRSLLFNTEHPDPSDPLHRFGVDDGDGYVADGHRWRFINAYLIFGQWKQGIVSGIRNLAAAYVATGDPAYAHKAGVLLDRVADLYPTMDFGKEGVMYEGPPRSGYVSTWHDACVEVQDLALAYDAVFDALAHDAELLRFLDGKVAKYRLDNPKTAFRDVQRNIEDRIFRDTLRNRPKIESNYPMTDATITTIHTVLGWPGNRAEVMAMLDAIITKVTAVDGLTGEKGIAGYSVLAPRFLAELLGRYALGNSDFIRTTVQRHPRLRETYRFHLDTWCLAQYYPRTGDTGSFAERNPVYAALTFTKNPGVNPSSFGFLWKLYEATGDVDFVRVLYGANGGSTNGLPYDLFAADPAAFQAQVAEVIARHGAEARLASVNKTEWGLAILRAGEGTNARAAWLDYDSGERHGHADGMNIGLFAKGLDFLPDFGYPPVQYGGWLSPRATWYTKTAAHNTVSVDGKDTRPGTGKTTLWFDGRQMRVVRASGPKLIGGDQFERTLALVDISAEDSYVVDVFRVADGSEHTRFLHGHFGNITSRDLALAPVEEKRFGEVMRNFQRDPNPAEGWSADFKLDDHLKYLPPGNDLHLRHTDLTRGTVVEVAEAWVSVGMFGGTAEAWIPSVLVRRRAEAPPLASTFVSVLEPYEVKSHLASIQRLPLTDTAGQRCPDGEVGIEVRLADGRRDLLLFQNTEGRSGSKLSRLVVPERDTQFEGDLCLVRFDAAQRPQQILFCHGKTLRAGQVLVRARQEDASFEIDLAQPGSPIVAGAADAVELIEVAGAKLWPK